MKKIKLLFMMALCATSVSAQKYMTRSGQVSFFSATPVENIEAFNNEVAAALDAGNGEVVLQVPVKSFKFEKQLMQEHFNENYMESDKFPKAVFKGNADPMPLQKDGVYKTTVKGKMTIHGQTKEVAVPGTITIKGKEMTLAAKFNISPADYKISIPAVAASKISKQIEVTVNSILKQL